MENAELFHAKQKVLCLTVDHIHIKTELQHTMSVCECVWGKQTPGWRLSALTVLPVKFLSWLPTLACHSSSEKREKLNVKGRASETE